MLSRCHGIFRRVALSRAGRERRYEAQVFALSRALATVERLARQNVGVVTHSRHLRNLRRHRYCQCFFRSKKEASNNGFGGPLPTGWTDRYIGKRRRLLCVWNPTQSQSESDAEYEDYLLKHPEFAVEEAAREAYFAR